MKCRDNPSGIALPVEKPKPPEPPKYGPLELQNMVARAAVRYMLVELYNIMGRDSAMEHTERYEAYRQLWHYTAKMLLGEDAPEIEVLT